MGRALGAVDKSSVGSLKFCLCLSTGWSSTSEVDNWKLIGSGDSLVNSTSNQNAKPCSGAGKNRKYESRITKILQAWESEEELFSKLVEKLKQKNSKALELCREQKEVAKWRTYFKE